MLPVQEIDPVASHRIALDSRYPVKQTSGFPDALQANGNPELFGNPELAGHQPLEARKVCVSKLGLLNLYKSRGHLVTTPQYTGGSCILGVRDQNG